MTSRIVPKTTESIDAAGLSDRGRVRPINEDHFLIGQLDKSLFVASTSMPIGDERRLVGAPEALVFCVADGLGGHAAGQRASSAAIDTIMHYLLHTMPCLYRAKAGCDESLHSELTVAVRRAQSEMRRLAVQDPSLRSMGTTFTLAFLQWPRLHLVHVGDSRCYLLRDGLTQLSTDHTVLQQRIADGSLTASDAAKSPLRHALWNAITDDESSLHVELSTHRLRPADTILLCSDGLSGELDDVAMKAILLAAKDSADAVQRLTEAANVAGGRDNITVLVIRVPSGLDAEQSEEVRLSQDPIDLTRLDQETPRIGGR
jgi:serine/threonine protein phosphatase PrpC